MHRRTVIRQAVVAALSGVSATVQTTLAYPEDRETLPSVTVITGTEVHDDDGPVAGVADAGDVWLQVRSLEVRIELRNTAGEDALDALCLEVEQALGASRTLGGEVHRFEPTGSSETELTGDIDKPIALRAIEYTAMYRVDARDPQALED